MTSAFRRVITVILVPLLVGSAIAMPAAAATQTTLTGEGSQTSPGGTATVSFTVTNTDESATASIVEITSLPEAWTVESRSDDGGEWITTESGGTWLWQTIGANSEKKPAVKLRVPSNATVGNYSVGATLKNASGVVERVNTTVTVSSPLHFSASVDNQETPGGEATIGFNVTNSGEQPISAILGVDSVSENWTVANHTDDGGTWESTNSTWLWQSIESNTSKSPSLTLSVPNETAPGNYTISTTLKTSTGVVTADDFTVVVTQQRSVSEAIAGDDGRISDTEIMNGIEHWRSGKPVPNTGNRTIGDIEVLQLIQKWKSGGTA